MNHPIKNWKAGAFAAIAEYYKVEAERAAFEERLEQAKQNCIKAGVTWRYGGPEVDRTDSAYACNCGAVVTYGYGVTIPGAHVCAECSEKAATAAREDAIASGRPDPAQPAPVEPPPDAKKGKKTDEEIPF